MTVIEDQSGAASYEVNNAYYCVNIAAAASRPKLVRIG